MSRVHFQHRLQQETLRGLKPPEIFLHHLLKPPETFLQHRLHPPGKCLTQQTHTCITWIQDKKSFRLLGEREGENSEIAAASRLWKYSLPNTDMESVRKCV